MAISPSHCIGNQPTATTTSMSAALILSTPLDLSSTAKLCFTSVSALISLTRMHTLRIWRMDFYTYNRIIKPKSLKSTEPDQPLHWSPTIQPQDKDNRTPLVVTHSPQLEHLRHINDLQLLLKNKFLRTHLKLAIKKSLSSLTDTPPPPQTHIHTPKLKKHLSCNRLLNSYSHQDTRPWSRPRCQLCLFINIDYIITK